MLAQAVGCAVLGIFARTAAVARVPGLAITGEDLAVHAVLVEKDGAAFDKRDRPRQALVQRGGSFASACTATSSMAPWKVRVGVMRSPPDSRRRECCHHPGSRRRD